MRSHLPELLAWQRCRLPESLHLAHAAAVDCHRQLLGQPGQARPDQRPGPGPDIAALVARSDQRSLTTRSGPAAPTSSLVSAPLPPHATGWA
ncbi:MAG: hypothetical protein ACRDY0_11320 [Acidimicrobiales bacterium]